MLQRPAPALWHGLSREGHREQGRVGRARIRHVSARSRAQGRPGRPEHAAGPGRPRPSAPSAMWRLWQRTDAGKGAGVPDGTAELSVSSQGRRAPATLARADPAPAPAAGTRSPRPSQHVLPRHLHSTSLPLQVPGEQRQKSSHKWARAGFKAETLGTFKRRDDGGELPGPMMSPGLWKLTSWDRTANV